MSGGGAIAKYQDIVEIQSDNERTLDVADATARRRLDTVMSMRYKRQR